jgi:hypothetical protein
MTRCVGAGVVAASALVLASLVGACDVSSPPAGRQIDGQWVDEPYPCPPEGPLTCEHLARCASKILWPEGAPSVDTYHVYSPPSRLQDGTIIVRGGWSVVVVFQPVDGKPRAVPVRETDDC